MDAQVKKFMDYVIAKNPSERAYHQAVQEVAERLGISTKSLYDWRNQLAKDKTPSKSSDEQLRIAQLEAELKRVKEERDILKKAAKYFASQPE
jgi:transposase